MFAKDGYGQKKGDFFPWAVIVVLKGEKFVHGALPAVPASFFIIVGDRDPLVKGQFDPLSPLDGAIWGRCLLMYSID